MHHAKLLFYRILCWGGTSEQKPSSLIDLQCPYWPRCEILTAPANWEILLSRHVQVIMKEGMQDKKESYHGSTRKRELARAVIRH